MAHIEAHIAGWQAIAILTPILHPPPEPDDAPMLTEATLDIAVLDIAALALAESADEAVTLEPREKPVGAAKLRKSWLKTQK